MISDFQKNFLKLFSGTALGQLIPIAVTPIITRLYSPEEIGSFAFYYSIIAIATGVINLKMDQALVISNLNSEVNRILRICLVFSKYISFSCLVLLSGAKLLALSGIIRDFPNWWFLLGAHFLYIGVIQSHTYFLNRYRLYGLMSKAKVLNGSTLAILQVLLFKLNELGLILGAFFSAVTTGIYIKNKAKLSVATYPRQSSSIIFSRIERTILKKYRSFPLYTSANGLLNSVSNNLPTMLLGSLYSYQVTGFYSWAARIIQTPMGFILSSMQQVFYQEVSSRYSTGGDINHLVKNTLKKLFLIGVIPYTLAFLFAPEIFQFIFGDQWYEAGVYTRYLVPWFFVMFLNSPITSIILVLNKQREYLIFELLLFSFRFLGIILGYLIWNSEHASIAIYGGVGFIYNVFLIFYLIKISKDAKY